MDDFDNNNINLQNDAGTGDAPVKESENTAAASEENAREEVREEPKPQRDPYERPSYESQPQTPPPTYQQQPYNGYYQQNPYYNRYQQPYRPDNQQNPQGYAQQPSQGYYHPETNEYVYSPAPTKKRGGAGKAAIIVIVSLLSLFVVSIFVSAALGFTKNADINPPDDGKSHNSGIFDHRDDKTTPTVPDKTAPDDLEKLDEKDTLPTATEPSEIRDFPTIEQLAAPEDAMPLPEIYDKLSRSVVGISCPVRGGTQTGTGFIISEDGYIVTNAHVIDGATSIMIVDGEHNEYNAEVIGSDTQTDIAVLRIDPEEIELNPVEFGKSGELRIGELTVAIGNPLGFDLYGTMTTGIVSGLNRSVTIGDNTMNLLQTSASINHGNSGGPLIDAYGRVIGITSAKIDSAYGEGLGFAIPIDEAVPIIENLIRYGYVPGRPSIGVSGQDITEMMSLFYNMPKGVYVFVVVEGSGADKAGIIPGDLIIGIEGESIENMEQLNAVKSKFSVGDTVTLTIYRKGQNFDVDVELTETRPSN